MKTKVCTKCHIEKDIKEFALDKNRKNGLYVYCKKCVKNQNRRYFAKFPWKRTLADIKKRCTNPKSKDYKYYGKRGIQCLITSNELKELWFRDKAYKMSKPSIDREENNGNYTFDNCQFIEQSENSKKMSLSLSRNNKGRFN